MAESSKSSVGRESDKFMLRLPEGMRDRIAALAKENGRSMNTEIVQRLEWALSLTAKPKLVDSSHVQHQIGGALTWLVTSEIKALADRERISFDEMFSKIVLAGLHPDAPQVLYLPVLPGATNEDLRAAVQATEGVARPDATVITENLWKAPWAPEWMVELLRARQPDIIAKLADGKMYAFETKYAAAEASPDTPERKVRSTGRKALDAKADTKKPD
jgi:hypothetical protein